MRRIVITLIVLCTLFVHAAYGANLKLKAHGGVLDLSGNSGFKVPAYDKLSGTNQFTVEFMFNMQEACTDSWCFPFGWTAGEFSNRIMLASGTTLGGSLRAYVGANSDTYANMSNPFTFGEWSHVALVYDGTLAEADRVKLYVDGTLHTFGTPTNGPWPATLNAMSPDMTFGDRVNALYDEIRVWNTAKTQTEIQNAMNQQLTGNEANLVSYYNFDERIGSDVKDISQNGSNGFLEGNATRLNFLGDSLSFDGVDDVVEVTDNDYLDLNNTDFAITTWARVDLSADSKVDIATKLSDTGLTYGGYRLYMQDGMIKFLTAKGTGVLVGTDTSYCQSVQNDLNDSKWHHYGVTMDNTNKVVNIYIDGVLDTVCNNTVEVVSTAENLLLGSLFKGEIAQVSIWNKTLSQEDIATLMHSAAPISDTNLVAYYPLNEGKGTTAYDNAHAHDGVITGTTWVNTAPTIYGDTIYTTQNMGTWTTPVVENNTSNYTYTFSNYSTNVQPIYSERILHYSDGGDESFDITATDGNTSLSLNVLVKNIFNIEGTAGDDTLTGAASNDTFLASAGNDTMDGLGGVDTVVYEGNFSSYTMTDNGDGNYSVYDGTYTDTLLNIEKLQFSDKTVLAKLLFAKERIVTGFRHTLAIKDDGTLWGWGYNEVNCITSSSNSYYNTAVQIGSDSDWRSVAAGLSFSLAIKQDGTLWAWGKNNDGQLGENNGTDSSVPIQVGSDNDWAKVAAGNSYSLGLKTDGTLWAWGQNFTGQLGLGDTAQRNAPVQIAGHSDFVDVVAGDFHAAALKADGTLWVWGRNTYGQLGDGTTEDKTSPIQVGSDSSWYDVSAGDNHTLALKGDGLWAWGANSVGQLGDGTTTQRSAPTHIAGDWQHIQATERHSLAIKTDGTLWTWGNNHYGQLGDGTTTDKTSPTQIGTQNNWHTLHAGDGYSTAVRSDGSFWAWGSNYAGQLAAGDYTDRAVPTEVLFSYAPFVVGTASSDTLNGTNAADVFVASTGDDTIDGLNGVDTVVYEGNFTSYTIKGDGSGSYTVSDGTNTDTLTNIEYITFADTQYMTLQSVAHVYSVNVVASYGKNDTLYVGQSATFACTNNIDSVDAYNWDADASGSAPTFSQTFTSAGSYEIMCTVSSNGKYYSDSLNVEVKPQNSMLKTIEDGIILYNHADRTIPYYNPNTSSNEILFVNANSFYALSQATNDMVRLQGNNLSGDAANYIDYAVDSAGYFHGVYLEPSDTTANEVHAVYVTNKTGTWSAFKLAHTTTAVPNYNAKAVSIAVDKNSDAITIMYNDKNTGYIKRTSSSDGVSWSHPREMFVPFGGTNTSPSWIKSGYTPTGELHVALFSDYYPDKELAVYACSDTTCTKDFNNTFYGNYANYTMDSNGTSYIVTADDTSSLNPANMLLFTNQSGTWQQQEVGLQTYGQGDFAIEVDDEGVIHIAHTIDGDGVNYETHISYINNSSGTFQEQFNVGQTYYITFSDMALRDGNVYVPFDFWEDDSIRLITYTGATTSDETLLVSNFFGANSQVATVDDTAYIMHSGINGEMLTQYDISTHTPVSTVPFSMSRLNEKALKKDSSSKLHAAYLENETFKYSYDLAGSNETNSTIHETGHTAFDIDMALDANDTAHVCTVYADTWPSGPDVNLSYQAYHDGTLVTSESLPLPSMGQQESGDIMCHIAVTSENDKYILLTAYGISHLYKEGLAGFEILTDAGKMYPFMPVEQIVLAASDNGKLHLFYDTNPQDGSGKKAIHYDIFDGTSWLDMPGVITTTAITYEDPYEPYKGFSVMEQNGTIGIAYVDRVVDKFELKFATSENNFTAPATLTPLTDGFAMPHLFDMNSTIRVTLKQRNALMLLDVSEQIIDDNYDNITKPTYAVGAPITTDDIKGKTMYLYGFDEYTNSYEYMRVEFGADGTTMRSSQNLCGDTVYEEESITIENGTIKTADGTSIGLLSGGEYLVAGQAATSSTIQGQTYKIVAFDDTATLATTTNDTKACNGEMSSAGVFVGFAPINSEAATHSVAIKAGWNLISLPAHANFDHQALGNTFRTHADKIEFITKPVDGAWQYYFVGMKSLPTVDKFGALASTKGFWLKASTDFTLYYDISEDASKADAITSLEGEWTLVGFNEDKTVEEIEALYDQQIYAMWVYIDGVWRVHVPSYVGITIDKDIARIDGTISRHRGVWIQKIMPKE